MSVPETVLFWAILTVAGMAGIVFFIASFLCVYFFMIGAAFDKTDGKEDTDLDKALRGEKEEDTSHEH